MDYLTVGVLLADGTHTGRLVVVVFDGGVQKAIKTLAIRDPGGAGSRRTVGRTIVHYTGPAPGASKAQHTGVVVHSIVTAVTVARHIACTLHRGHGILHAHIQRKAASAERIDGTPGTGD
jgi:hypothetical protein